MEISYKRHFTKSYMIVKAEGLWQESYEAEILSYNRIPGLLQMQTEISDGQIYFWYDITGMQTLGDYLSRRRADGRMYRTIFQTILKVCETTAAYLLEENGVCLETEYIFLDMDGEKIAYVYVPGKKESLRDGFQRLMEQLLRNLDHNDKTTMNMAYEVYQRSLNDQVDLYNLLKQVATMEQVLEETVEETGEEIRKSERMNKAIQTSESRGEFIPKTESVIEGKHREEEPHYFEKLFHRIKENHVGNFLSGFRERWKKEGQDKSAFFDKRKRKEWEYNNEELCYVTGEEAEVTYPTELLAGSVEVQGMLVYQGEQPRRNLKVDKTVYLLGKQEQDVDGYIEGKSVSRIHAKIEQEDGAFYIEDMNSTNGTYLNGEVLEYKQRMKLDSKDRISFGAEEYLFL